MAGLRLTPAYSVRLVQEIIARLPKDSHIIDPFSGTATTGIVAGKYGHPSSLFDINPFLVWFGNVKLQTLTCQQAAALRKAIREITIHAQNLTEDEFQYPQISNIERWWNSETLKNIAKVEDIVISVDSRTTGFIALRSALGRFRQSSHRAFGCCLQSRINVIPSICDSVFATSDSFLL